MRTVMLACCLAVPLAGCSAGDALFSSGKPASIQEVNAAEGARVLTVASCPLSQERSEPGGARAAATARAIGPVAGAAIAGVAAEVAFKAVSEYLKERREALTASYFATGAGDIATGCIVVVRGTFGPTKPADQLQNPAADPGLTRDDLQALGLVDHPHLYVEISMRELVESPPRVTPARRGTTAEDVGRGFILRPELVQFADTAAERRGDGKKRVAIILGARNAALPANAAAADAAKDAVGSAAFNLGDLRIGTIVRPRAGESGHPFAAQERLIRIPAANLGRQVNLHAFVTESADPSRVERLVGEAISNNSESIQTALSDLINNALAVRQPAGNGN